MRRFLTLVAALAVAATGCGPKVARGDRGPSPFPEYVGPEILLPPAEGRARLKKARPLKEKAYVYIEASPPDTEIRVDGALKGTGKASFPEHKARFRLLTLSAPGYGRVDGFVELEERQVVKLRVVLRRAGALTVLTEPDGAEVTFDGLAAGHTPVTLRDLEPGSHRVDLAAGSWRWSEDVTIDATSTTLLSMDVPEQPAVAAAPPPPAPPAPPPPPAKPAPIAGRTSPAPAPASRPAPPPPPPPAAVAVAAAPAPAPARAASRPDCGAVCDRYTAAVHGTESFRDIVRDRCRARCDSDDLRFSVCAWKTRTMDDVEVCAAMPEGVQ
jgi:hypothetical protein